jgi:hypothetical protein
MKPVQLAAIAFMLGAIGLLVYGIVTDKPMVTIAMPLLIVGIALGAQARKNEGK